MKEIQQILLSVPETLIGVLTDVRQTGCSECWKMRTFKLVFRFDDRHDMVVSFNVWDDDRDDDVDKVMENADYSCHLLRQIANCSRGLFPFIADEVDDFGVSIRRRAVWVNAGLTPLEKEKKAWEIRQALSIEERGWYMEEMDDYAMVYLTGRPEHNGNDTWMYVCIPYGRPKGHYLDILKRLDLWMELLHTWEWPSHGAIGLIERAEKQETT